MSTPAQEEGGIPIGVGLVSPGGRRGAYPLVNPSPDIQGLLADLQLSLSLPVSQEVALPLRIVSLRGLGQPTSLTSSGGEEPAWNWAAGIVIADAQGVVLFDSELALDYQFRGWGPRLGVHHWIGATASCLIVQHTVLPEEETREWPHILYPELAILDARCWERAPARLESLEVLGQTISGSFLLEAGYNTVLSVQAIPSRERGKSLRRRSRVRVDLVPGTGLGQYPGCQEAVQAVRHLSGVAPDTHGDVQLSAQGCLWLRGLLEETENGLELQAGLRLGSQCEACCRCEDYANTYRALTRIQQLYQTLGAQAETLRDQHAQNLARWDAGRACREENPLRVLLIAPQAGQLVIQAVFSNVQNRCVQTVELFFALTPLLAPVSSLSLVPGGNYVSDDRSAWSPGGISLEEGLLQAHWDQLEPGGAARLRATVAVPATATSSSSGPGSAEGCPEAVTVVAWAEVGGVALGNPVERSLGLLCDDGETLNAT